MNDRILELAKESGISFGGHPMNPLSVYPSELEKFAESIIRECMRMCEVAEVGLLTHGLREESFGAINAKRCISDWFECE